MLDPLCDAIEIVDQARTMPAAKASRYLFDRYRLASPDFRDEIVLALAGALVVARLQAGSIPQPRTAERTAAQLERAVAP